MNLETDYYPYLDVKGKSVDLIFRELCTNDDYRQVEDGTWKETVVNRFGKMLDEMPNVRTTANRVLRDGMLERGHDIDPEKLYFNIFSNYVIPKDVSKQNLYHTADMLKESYRLTDAALMNVFKLHYGGSYYLLKTWRTTGIYTVGKNGSAAPNKPDYGRCWGAHNSIFLAFEPADILASGDGIEGEFSKDYNAYWTKYSDLYRDMLADFFLLAAINQYKAGLLSEYGFAMARKVYAKQDGVSTYLFNINTYKANDIIVIEGTVSGMNHTILYIPGSSIPFIEFDNVRQMKMWIVRQLANQEAMTAFLKHFSIYNRQDGPTYTGVENIVKKMAVEDAGWDPQYYILLKPEKIAYNLVFEKVRDRTKEVMHNDTQKQITTDSELYRDYALNFVETFLNYTPFLTVIIPEVGIPLEFVLSLTALGLSSDIAINGDTLKKRLDGVGSLTFSVTNIAVNMLPIFKKNGGILRNFRRVASQIPHFADENRFIMNTFHIESKSALNNIRPDDPPILLNSTKDELRLVRLADGSKPLAVLSRVSGNKFARVNPITLKELEGESLISEVLGDNLSRRTVYLSGSSIRGGAPYNPFDYFFDEVWTLQELKRKADNLGLGDDKYRAIKSRLNEMHTATDFDTKQQAAHKLLYQLEDYNRTYPSASRNAILNSLAIQIKGIIYPINIKFLGKYLAGPGMEMHPFVASRIYRTSQAESLGELPHNVTFGLIKFAQADPILSVTGLSKAAQKAIPADISFPVKYVIPELKQVNKLDVNFTLLPEYASEQLSLNRDVFLYALNKSQRLGLLKNLRVVPGKNMSLYIGYNYDELLSMINEYSSSATTRFGTHPRNVLQMIDGLLKGGGEGEMMKQFGRNEHFETIVKERLSNTERNMSMYDRTILDRFDHTVENVYKPFFESQHPESARLAKMMESPNGIVVKNGSLEINYCRNNLDFFKENGVTHLGLTNFFADTHQAELDAFMGGGFLTSSLEAIILVADKGADPGPLRNLMVAARGKGLKAVALGHSDNALYSRINNFKNSYNKGIVVRNASRLLRGNKSIVLADLRMINTTPGLIVPSIGLAQELEAPGFIYLSGRDSLDFIPDLPANRAPIFIQPEKNWKPLAPEPGRFLGWRSYGDGFTFVTQVQREATIFAKIDQDLEGFKEKLETIHNIASRFTSAKHGVCDIVAASVKTALSNAGERVGKGRALSWWELDGDRFVNSTHTAPTVYIRDVEYAVDAAHLQFPHELADEGVMILPVEEWAEEILNRVKAHNPYMTNKNMLAGTLLRLRTPDFTRPRVRILPK